MYGYLVSHNNKIGLDKLEFKPYCLNSLLVEEQNRTVIDFRERRVYITIILKPNFSFLSKEMFYPFSTFTSIEFTNKVVNIIVNDNNYEEVIKKDSKGIYYIEYSKLKLDKDTEVNIKFEF